MSQSATPERLNIASQRRAAGSAADTRELSMRGFLAWLAASFVVSFGLIWIYVAVMPMAFLSRDYPLWVAKRAMLDECQLGTVAVFGDSRTLAATMPSAMSLPVTNFAMSGSSPIETYFAVRRALRCPNLPKIVIIAHGALKFTGDSDYWVSSARNGFLSYADMRQVENDAARVNDREIAKQQDDRLPTALRALLFSLRFPAFYFDSLISGGVAVRWQHNTNALHESLMSSGHALFGTANGSSDIAIEGFGPAYQTSPLIDLYFSETLALLAKHGVPVYVISMPVNQATYARTRQELKDRFAGYLESKARGFPNLHVIGPAIPCWPDRFFGDAWHFNAAGANEYSHALGELLRTALAGNPPANLPNRCTDSEADTGTKATVFAASQTAHGEK